MDPSTPTPRGSAGPLALALAATLALLAAGCGSTPETGVGGAYLAPEVRSRPLRRIVLAPVSLPREHTGTAGVVERAMRLALQRALGAEVVPAERLDIDIAGDADLLERGLIATDALLAASRRAHIDGVAFVRIDDAEPYPPQRLALRLQLLSSGSGALLFSNACAFDAADLPSRERLATLAAERGFEGHPTLGADLVLLSRDRFAELACAYLLAPLRLPG